MDRVLTPDLVPFIQIRNPILQAPSQLISTYTYASSVTFDLNASKIHILTLQGNPTLYIKNVSIGQEFSIKLVQDSTGSRTVTWFSGIHWAGGSAPVLTVTASHWDTMSFMCTALNVYEGKVWGANFS